MAANKGQAFMFLAVLLGLAAAAVGYYSLTALATRTAQANNRNSSPVVVTVADLTFGQKLEPTMLKVVNYPKDAVPMGAFSTLDSVVGQTTKVFMSAREPVTAIKLSSRGGGLSMLIRPTMRAASLEVNQVSGVSGFVLPGDRVDVLVTVQPRNGMDDAITHTVLQNIEVLAAGQKTQQQDNKPITVQAVTLLVDPQGAQMLAHAEREGEIQLILRNPEDQDTTKVATVSTRMMLGEKVAVALPRRGGGRSSAPPAQIVVQRAPAVKPNIRIIRSANVTETPAIADTTAH